MSKQAFYALLLFGASLVLHLTVTVPSLWSRFTRGNDAVPAPASETTSPSVPVTAPQPALTGSAPAPAPAPDPAQAPKTGNNGASASPHPVDPAKDGRMSQYAECIASFLDDITAYKTCLDRHSGTKCWFDSNVMTDSHDSHNCLSMVSGVASLTYNARVIARAHDVCYSYLVTFGECIGLAVEMQDLSPCFRKEVYARFGLVVRECKSVADFQEPPGEAMWRTAVARVEQAAAARLLHVLRPGPAAEGGLVGEPPPASSKIELRSSAVALR